MPVTTTSHLSPIHDDRPIGVFDSGIGGLSVLRALMQTMPERRFIYLADIAYAPYGEQPDAYIVERSQKIAHWMYGEQNTCGMVIACNTATAAAAKAIRDAYPQSWPIIAVEPGLKPAAALSETGKIAIMATASTLKSAKLQALIQHTKEQAQKPLTTFLCPCNGLAKAIDDHDEDSINTLIERYTAQVKASASDVVVLGCTHYCLVAERITQALPGVHVLDTGNAIAQRALAVLPPPASSPIPPALQAPQLSAWTNASTQQLQQALAHWLPHTQAQVHFWSHGA